MATETTPTRLPLDALISALLRLRAPQQIFLAKFIASGIATGSYDGIGACRVAYPHCKNPKVRAAQILGSPKIRQVLDLHVRRSTAESLLARLRLLIKRSRRQGANLTSLEPAWNRIAAALEKLVAKESAHE